MTTTREAAMQSMEQFIERHKITSTVSSRTPTRNEEKSYPNGSHWSVRLRNKRGKSITVPYNMGSAHMGEPELVDVLDCLASDASGVENAASFRDWADEYGLDADSRRAEATFRAIERQSARLRTFLGDAYDELLWATERP